MKKLLVISVAIFTCFIISCLNRETSRLQQVMIRYRNMVENLVSETSILLSLSKQDSGLYELRNQFNSAKYAYKKIEWLAEYYQPFTTKYINGPAVPEAEPENKEIIIQPEGFQVIEELLFANDSLAKPALTRQVELLLSNVKRLEITCAEMETTDAHVFDALRQEIFRIISLGLSGFDSPVAENTIRETSSALYGIENIIEIYKPALEIKDPGLSSNVAYLFSAAQTFLSIQKEEDSFDRMRFIRTYLNPLSENLLEIQNALSIPVFTETRLLRPNAKNLFAGHIFQPDAFAPDTASFSTPVRIELGKRLFYDKNLSGNGKRSCASCHNPALAFTDGLKTSSVLNGTTKLKRNTPTLINASLQSVLFYDGRLNYLEDQATEVIQNKDEMHGSVEGAVKLVINDSVYMSLYNKSYGNVPISGRQLMNALAAYVRSLIGLNSRFDLYMRGRSDAMSREEVDGFNIYMGKARCGTCHFLPLFNGESPPEFSNSDMEVLGVPGEADTVNAVPDTDPGRYEVFPVDLYRSAFRTPGLRNIALTAPYMHNGIFKTLEQVVDFYDRGGGKGLKLPVNNQTLPSTPLFLTQKEKHDLIAFLGSLTDTSCFITNGSK